MDNTEIIKIVVNRINIMINLLQAVKTNSPLGKTLKVLINLCLPEENNSVKGEISYRDLLVLTKEISEKDLQEALNYLHQSGVISSNSQNG